MQPTARKTDQSQSKINDMEVVQYELVIMFAVDGIDPARIASGMSVTAQSTSAESASSPGAWASSGVVRHSTTVAASV